MTPCRPIVLGAIEVYSRFLSSGRIQAIKSIVTWYLEVEDVCLGDVMRYFSTIQALSTLHDVCRWKCLGSRDSSLPMLKYKDQDRKSIACELQP